MTIPRFNLFINDYYINNFLFRQQYFRKNIFAYERFFLIR